jgi:transposase-like protein
MKKERVMQRHRRRSRQEWEQVIEEQEQSGLSARAFCRREAIGISSFYQWRRRLSDGSEPSIETHEESFIDMGRIEESISAASFGARSLVVTLDLGNGTKLTLKRG